MHRRKLGAPRSDLSGALLCDEGGSLVVDAHEVRGSVPKIRTEVDVQLVRAVNHCAGRATGRHPIQHGHCDRLSYALNLMSVLLRAAARQARSYTHYVLGRIGLKDAHINAVDGSQHFVSPKRRRRAGNNVGCRCTRNGRQSRQYGGACCDYVSHVSITTFQTRLLLIRLHLTDWNRGGQRVYNPSQLEPPSGRRVGSLPEGETSLYWRPASRATRARSWPWSESRFPRRAGVTCCASI
jgi:hypothetical protein